MTIFAGILAVVGVLGFLTSVVIILAANAPLIDDESQEERRRRLAKSRRHHPVESRIGPTMDRDDQLIRMLDQVERMRIDSQQFQKAHAIVQQLARELGHGRVSMDFGSERVVFRWTVSIGNGRTHSHNYVISREAIAMASPVWVAGTIADIWKRSLAERRISEPI